jgi:uncharacterized protein (TIGR02452 family)
MGNRGYLAELGRQAVAILEAGAYQSPSGQTVHIREDLDRAVEETRLYHPDGFGHEVPAPLEGETVIEVTSESTIAAARRLDAASPGCAPCCLNFASARHPGGGFLSGARAQEESLARSSGLYASLIRMREMYDYNRGRSTCLYSDYMIWSPRVPVFRDETWMLLETPFLASFITAPAVNAGALHPHERVQIEPTMRRRAEKVLRLAYRQDARTLVLGAWGCGVFRNDPAMVASLFAGLLRPRGLFHNVFEKVVFAVLDFTQDRSTLAAFREHFPNSG